MGDNENTPHALDAELAVMRLRAHGFSAEAAVLVGRSDAAWNMLRALRDALLRMDPAWCDLHGEARPTWERIEWLLAEGFSKARIARELGMKRPALQLNRHRVTVRNAAKVEALWRRYQA